MRNHTLGLIALGAFFVAFLAYPLAYVFSGAFSDTNGFSLQYFTILLTTPYYQEIVAHSFNIALTVTIVSSIIAYVLAFSLTRFRIPCSTFLTAILLAPLIVPPFVGVIGIKQLLGRFGSLNVLLINMDLIKDPIDWLGVDGMFGVISLQVAHLTPILFLTLRASLVNSHRELEEAAMLSGGSRLRILRSITLPLTIPGWFAGATLVFIASFTDLGTPLMFDYRGVASVQVFNMLSDINANPVGYSLVVFVCLLSVSLFIASKSVFFQGGFVSTDKYSNRSPYITLPRSLSICMACALAAYGILASLPQLALCLVALSNRWFMTVLPSDTTITHFLQVFAHPITTRSIAISLALSTLATLATVALGFCSAHIITRAPKRISIIMDYVSLLPLAIPGIVIAFGFIGAYSGTFLDNRINPLPLLVCAYSLRRLPTLIRTATAGFQEANVSLEDAAYTVGASRYLTFRAIVFPLVKTHLYAGALLTFAYSMVEVSDSLFLALEERYYPIAKAMYALIGRPDGIELASALGVLVMAMLMVLFFVSQRLSAASTKPPTFALALATLIQFPSFATADELVVVSPHWEGIRAEFSAAFADTWKSETGKSVAFRWLDVGGTSDIVKYVKGEFRRTPKSIGIDVFFGGGSDSFLELQRFGLLAPAHVPEPVLKHIPKTISGVPLYSPTGHWFANSMSTFGILCNNEALRLLGKHPPQSWADLGDPRFDGYIGAGDLRKSGSMHAMYEIILQGYGWDKGWPLLYRIGHNTRRFTNNASQVGKDVATGEVLCGIVIDTYANDIARQLGSSSVSFILPKDFVSVNGDGVAILKGAPNMPIAQAFTEFLLSEKAQRLWYAKKGTENGPKKFEIGKLSILPSIYKNVEPASLFQGNPFTIKNLLPYNAGLASERWNILNDLIGTYIIDQHHQLKTASYEVLPSSPPLNEAKLADLQETIPWGDNTELRARKVADWSTHAQALLRTNDITSQSEQASKIPIVLVTILFISTFIYRRRKLRPNNS